MKLSYPHSPHQIELAIRLAKAGNEGLGELEFDDNPDVSDGEDGVWVKAWVFVSNYDIQKELKK